MLYRFALLRSPLRLVPDRHVKYTHAFGGPLGPVGVSDADRFARVLTLDLGDPLLGFLRFEGLSVLPLLMDFCEGSIDYSIRADGTVDLHSKGESTSRSLLPALLGTHPATLIPISYAQYRATALAAAVIDDDFLASDDAEALASLGETFTQVGGRQLRGSGNSPYCGNPACPGYRASVMISLATVSQFPAPGVALDFLPYDPAIEFSLCLTCHSLSGIVIPD